MPSTEETSINTIHGTINGTTNTLLTPLNDWLNKALHSLTVIMVSLAGETRSEVAELEGC